VDPTRARASRAIIDCRNTQHRERHDATSSFLAFRVDLAYAHLADGYQIANPLSPDGLQQTPSLRTRFQLKQGNFFLELFSRMQFVANVPAITLKPHVVGHTARHAL